MIEGERSDRAHWSQNILLYIYRPQSISMISNFYTNIKKIVQSVKNNIHVLYFLFKCFMIILINSINNECQSREAFLIKTFVKNTEGLLLK